MTDYLEHDYQVYTITHYLSVRIYGRNRVELVLKGVGSVFLNDAETRELIFTLHRRFMEEVVTDD